MRIQYGDVSLDILFENSNLEFRKDCALISLVIKEKINEMPSFELELFAPNFADYVEAKDMVLVYNSTNLNYRVPMGIKDIRTKGTSIQFRGYLCPNAFFRDVKNIYLGNSVKAAIQQINLRRQVICDNDFSYDIFQISCSDMDQVIGMCNELSSTPYWAISRTAVILQSGAIVDAKDSPMSPSSNGRIRRLLGANIEEISQEDSSGGFHTVFGTSRFLVPITHPEEFAAGRNYALNLTAQYYTPEFILVNEYENEFDHPAGTKFKNYFTEYSKYRFWTALSVEYTYTTKGRSSMVTWGATN